MISRERADELLELWSKAELGEIRKLWYSPVTPGLHEHTGRKYRETAVEIQIDDGVLESAGRAMAALRSRHPRDHRVLVTNYIESKPVGPKALRIALDAFALVYAGP